jgi:hypothetical protein
VRPLLASLMAKQAELRQELTDYARRSDVAKLEGTVESLKEMLAANRPGDTATGAAPSSFGSKPPPVEAGGLASEALGARVRRAEATLAASAAQGEDRVISDCHFSVQLNHFIPGFLSYSVAAFSKVTIGYHPRRGGPRGLRAGHRARRGRGETDRGFRGLT